MQVSNSLEDGDKLGPTVPVLKGSSLFRVTHFPPRCRFFSSCSCDRLKSSRILVTDYGIY
jgi:hypothetical protein